MARRTTPIVGILACLVLACSGRPMAKETSDDSSTTPTSDLGGTETDTGPEFCEGAALEYHGVCFFPYSVEAMGHDHPLDLDGEPGHELVGVDDGKVSVHEWNGDGFDLVGEAELPGEVSSSINAGVVAGEFDDVPGLDLVVSERGEWAALYHVDEAGAPTLVGPTEFFDDDGNRAFDRPVAIGPDDSGRWRVIAHYENGDDSLFNSDPLALWEVNGNMWTQVERLSLPTGACQMTICAPGDFDGDGRQDAVCTIEAFEDYCSSDPPEENIVHVVLLAQPDGTVTTAAYPTTLGSMPSFVADIDGDSFPDLLWAYYYRLADGQGGLLSTTDVSPPPEPGWHVVTVGVLEATGPAKVLLGDGEEGRIFVDLVQQSDDYEAITLAGAMFTPFARGALDLNGDGIADLPGQDQLVLVSEVQP